MRIVGGRLGGRTLAGPKSQAIRPTSDRLRESLFNILAHAHGDPLTRARGLDPESLERRSHGSDDEVVFVARHVVGAFAGHLDQQPPRDDRAAVAGITGHIPMQRVILVTGPGGILCWGQIGYPARQAA